MLRIKRLSVDLPEELMAKLKGYSAFRGKQLRMFVTRILYEAVVKIEQEEMRSLGITHEPKELQF